MRVLHFGKFATRQFGGIESHVQSLTRGLAAAGVDVVNVVYDIGRTRGGIRRDLDHGVGIVGIPCRGTLASLPIAPAMPGTVSRMVRERPFDIVHAHFPDPLALFAMPFASPALRIASWHSDIVRQRRFGKVYGAIARRAFAPLDAVVGATPSHLESRQIDDFRPRRRAVIPYGLDLARFAAGEGPQAERLRASTGGRPAILALGRHVYYKGFDDLIDAMADVDAVLWLGGEGPLTPALEARAAARRGKGEVRFVGRIEDADLPAWYRAASLFAFPSTEPSEAFGIVQLEAMASGRPIVNCRLGNAVNFVAPEGEVAVTVPPRDAPALAAALNRLLDDAALRATLGARGVERVRTRFSESAMVDATIALYRDVLEMRRAR